MDLHNIIKYLPTPIINFLRFMRSIFIKKNEAELSYWKKNIMRKNLVLAIATMKN